MQSLKQIHLESLNLTLNSQSTKRDEWEGVCSAHKDVKNVRSPRGSPWSWPNTIYRHPNKIELLCSNGCLCMVIGHAGRCDWTLPPQRLVARSPPCVLAIQPRPLDRNGQNTLTHVVKVRPDSLLEVTGLTNTWCPVESSKGPESLKTD
jgi:hypothetical protein